MSRKGSLSLGTHAMVDLAATPSCRETEGKYVLSLNKNRPHDPLC
jgi:hypothetical protein